MALGRGDLRIAIPLILAIVALAAACTGGETEPSIMPTASGPTPDVPATVEAGVRGTQEVEAGLDATVQARVAATLTTATPNSYTNSNGNAVADINALAYQYALAYRYSLPYTDASPYAYPKAHAHSPSNINPSTYPHSPADSHATADAAAWRAVVAATIRRSPRRRPRRHLRWGFAPVGWPAPRRRQGGVGRRQQ